MYNDLFSIGPFTVHGYGLMIAIGIVTAYSLAESRAKKTGLDPDRLFGIVLWSVCMGFVGSKALYYITILDQVIADPSILLDLSSGWVVYGGILAGLLTAYLYCRHWKISFFQYADLLMPVIALAQGFGRIGCFLAGCCYGVRTDLPIAVTFTHSHFAPNGVPLFPTQLFSSAFDFALFFVLSHIWKREHPSGSVTAWYLILYSVGRFLIEFVRGDLARGTVGVLSTSQFISLFVFAYGIWLLRRSRSGRTAEREKE